MLFRSLTNAFGRVGRNAGSIGAAAVSGVGSKWINNNNLTIGDYGQGTLAVETSGEVSNRSFGILGFFAGSTGMATVSGTGSKWTSGSGLIVGYFGSGTLGIDTGGQVSSENCTLGSSAGSTGAATVTGVGSVLTSGGGISVGAAGSGKLTVADGGMVIAKTLNASPKIGRAHV